MSSNTESTLKIDGPVATITIATANGLNVMSSSAVGQLGDVVRKAAAAGGVRFTVIRAEGKVFVAGADIKEMDEMSADAAREFSRLGSACCDAIAEQPSITVAAIQGAALGGGCEIALACDFRIVAADARIGMPETRLGLIPGWGGIPRAMKLLGPAHAKRLIFSGAPVTAADAERIGLVDQVVSDAAALDAAVLAIGKSFAKSGPRAIALAKRAMRDGRDVAAFAECFQGRESREGMGAFIQKRTPDWVKG